MEFNQLYFRNILILIQIWISVKITIFFFEGIDFLSNLFFAKVLFMIDNFFSYFWHIHNIFFFSLVFTNISNLVALYGFTKLPNFRINNSYVMCKLLPSAF
jgi:hypothetical protein